VVKRHRGSICRLGASCRREGRLEHATPPSSVYRGGGGDHRPVP
jgi:hypothetical protein